MPTIGPDRATLEVFVFREGVLARAGHDLLLRATRFSIAIDPAARTATAEIDAASLRVVSALRDGRPLPGALSAGDVRDIEANVAGTILRARDHPTIRFVSEPVAPREGGGYDVRGTLTLVGVARALAFSARPEGDRLVAELRLAQPEFGIRPFTAMLGALKVRPLVGIRVTLAASDVA